MTTNAFTEERIEGLEDEVERAKQDRDKWQARAERLHEILDNVVAELNEYRELCRKGRL